jgi:hypothetical protein
LSSRTNAASIGSSSVATQRPSWVVDGEALCHVPAAGCAREHGGAQPDRLHERADVVGEVAQPVAVR